LHCFRAIAASNIKEIVYLNNYNNDDMVAILAHDSSIIIRRIIHIDSLLVSI
jgi:hypothetical protein